MRPHRMPPFFMLLDAACAVCVHAQSEEGGTVASPVNIIADVEKTTRNFVDSARAMAAAYLATGEPEKARAICELVATLDIADHDDGKFADVAFGLAEWYCGQGRAAEAYSIYHLTFALPDSDAVSATRTKIRTLLNRHDFEDAPDSPYRF